MLPEVTLHLGALGLPVALPQFLFGRIPFIYS
jgi:hypothetical protein